MRIIRQNTGISLHSSRIIIATVPELRQCIFGLKMSHPTHNPGRKLRLPIPPNLWESEDSYVSSLLHFATTSILFQNLCGGVHILDFLTRTPDLYSTVLPGSWRDYVDGIDVHAFLNLLMRDELDEESVTPLMRDGRVPVPADLMEYVRTIRGLSLLRKVSGGDENGKGKEAEETPRHLRVGMKPKKLHEVTAFARYVNDLVSRLESPAEPPLDSISVKQKQKQRLSLVDFGSGQNYLGRMLASPPYERHIYAIEKRHHNVAGARGMDVYAKLARKEVVLRNKKEWREEQQKLGRGRERRDRTDVEADGDDGDGDSRRAQAEGRATDVPSSWKGARKTIAIAEESSGKGRITYIEHDIKDGHLQNVVFGSEKPDSVATTESTSTSSAASNSSYDSTISPSLPSNQLEDQPLMVISLHSCGNLIHHGLQSLILNPSVRAVAMIGCCYNLMTERLGPPTYKLPSLRPNHPRLEATSNAHDPHGFPMSKHLENYPLNDGQGSRGIRLNITARMMGVQAPQNWGREDSEMFFRRHFYRALLQRILLDRGVVKQASSPDDVEMAGGSLSGQDEGGTPLIVGSLKKACFQSFKAYVRGAMEKLSENPEVGAVVREKASDLLGDKGETEVERYERDFGYAKKNLAVIWSLMAFSAGVVESIIAVDRWQFLREQACVEDCWIEPVFDYRLSPRNLVVVGVKKQEPA